MMMESGYNNPLLYDANRLAHPTIMSGMSGYTYPPTSGMLGGYPATFPVSSYPGGMGGMGGMGGGFSSRHGMLSGGMGTTPGFGGISGGMTSPQQGGMWGGEGYGGYPKMAGYQGLEYNAAERYGMRNRGFGGMGTWPQMGMYQGEPVDWDAIFARAGYGGGRPWGYGGEFDRYGKRDLGYGRKDWGYGKGDWSSDRWGKGDWESDRWGKGDWGYGRGDRGFDRWGREDWGKGDIDRFEMSRELVPGQRKLWRPRSNIVDMQDKILLEFELPGVSRDMIDLAIGDTYVILQSIRDLKWNLPENMYQSERHFGAFNRKVELPFPIDPMKAEAVLDHGILKVFLTKKSQGNVISSPSMSGFSPTTTRSTSSTMITKE